MGRWRKKRSPRNRRWADGFRDKKREMNEKESARERKRKGHIRWSTHWKDGGL